MINERIKPYLTDIQEQDVFHGTGTFTDEYKALIEPVSNKLVSIMPKTYKPVSNKEVIEPFLEFLEKTDIKYSVDTRNSYYTLERMNLVITCPEIVIPDDKDGIGFQMRIHNSYDGSEGVRILSGGIRYICSNGMIFGREIMKYYKKHTTGFTHADLEKHYNRVVSQTPVIGERIKVLQEIEARSADIEKGLQIIGKNPEKETELIQELSPLTLWQVYNYLTNYVTFKVNVAYRASMLNRISKQFAL